MLTSAEVVFQLDVDNTLLDNDRFGYQSHGSPRSRIRRSRAVAMTRNANSLGADYLGSPQKFRIGREHIPAADHPQSIGVQTHRPAP